MYYILFLILNVFEVETIEDVEINGLYRYFSTYEIIKKADAIVLGVALETEDTELGPWQLIRVDNVLKGEIKDSIIEYPEHVWEEEIILFLKEVDKEEVILKKGKTFKYGFGYMQLEQLGCLMKKMIVLTLYWFLLLKTLLEKLGLKLLPRFHGDESNGHYLISKPTYMILFAVEKS